MPCAWCLKKIMLKIDGSYGEGGGQILRTALALSCHLGIPFELYKIRANRPKPGLQPQHLTCVRASQKITNAIVKGDEISSQNLKFYPGKVLSGEYFFDVAEKKGSAGSTSLILQTVFLPLCFAPNKSIITLKGGTHVYFSPVFHYLDEIFLPMAKKIGLEIKLELKRWGFYPKGGGEVVAQINPINKIFPLNIKSRGKFKKLSGLSLVSDLHVNIAQRQLDQLTKRSENLEVKKIFKLLTIQGFGAGTLVFLKAEFDNTCAGFSSLGEIGKPAEKVADDACDELEEFLKTKSTVDKHLADQLIPYLALSKGKSYYQTIITRHLLTNVWVIKQFLPEVKVEVEGEEGKEGKVSIIVL